MGVAPKMAGQIDRITKDEDGFVRVGCNGDGVVLFRVLDTGSGPVVHIRLKANCKQVKDRGSPDFYIPWDEFVQEIER